MEKMNNAKFSVKYTLKFYFDLLGESRAYLGLMEKY